MPRSNLMIVQGGGPTAVLNRTLAEIITEAQHDPSFGSIYGARYGVKGVIKREVLDLTGLTAGALDLLRKTPGAALGSSRHSPSDDELERMIETLRSLHIERILFVGGNGTMRGASRLSDLCRAAGLDVQIVGVPKTVDNDIAGTDRCPGYASAARYMMQATQELGADLRSLPQPVTILETMGRDVGWIAAAAALARDDAKNDGECPQLLYVPEVAFDTEQFLAALERVVREIGWVVVVVAEGLRKPDGSFVYQSTAGSQVDSLQRPMTGGVGQYLATVASDRLGIRCRCEKPGLLGRASIAHVSQQDIRDSAAVGRAAVQALAAGARDVMVALRPLDKTNVADTTLVPLAEATAERSIPRNWLGPDKIPLREEFFEYLRPLVGTKDHHLRDLGAPISGIGE
ncbi:MAG: diphosphate--fructose-6-phosphate 1-phosphotransferase [Acidobacteriaceae bacterium]